nr:hypothetical protein [uncultured Pseudomonas sp.]
MPDVNRTESDEEEKWFDRETDLLNDNQRALVIRAQDLLKLMLLLSGGALAVCASFFSSGANLILLQKLVAPIQAAWILLTVSILLFVLSLVLLLTYDYDFHQKRLQFIERKVSTQRNTSEWWHRSAWYCGLIGFVCFCGGMGAFCWAALGYLQPQ